MRRSLVVTAAMPTGKRLALPLLGMPRNAAGWDNQITPPAPTTSTPNRAGPDPHGSPRKTPAAQLQKSEHLRIGGTVIDTCG